MKHFTWMMLAVALALGCEEEAEESGGETVVEATQADEDTAQAEGDEADTDTLPTPEDFEEEAAEAITPDNLEDELAQLEKTLDEEQGD